MLARFGLKRTFGKTVTFNSNNPNIALNWKLAKFLVTPRNGVSVNSASSGSQGSGNTVVVCQDNTDWPLPLHIAVAKTISASSGVFIEEGEVNGITARVISGEENLASQGRAILSGDSEYAESNGITVLLTSGVNFEGNLFYDQNRRLAIGNEISQADITEIMNQAY